MENKSNSLNRIKRHQREKVLRFSIRKYSFGAASVAIAALMFLGARVVSADTVSGSSSPSTAGVVQPNDKSDSHVGIKEPTENKSEVVNNSLENKETAIVENSSNTVDKAKLKKVVEELNVLLSTKLNLDESVLSSVKERVQKAQVLLDKADAVQKDINELKELLSTDLATLSNAVKESSKVQESTTKTEAEKPASESSSEERASEENQSVSAKKDSLKVSVDQLQAAISEVPEHDTTKEVLEKANEVMVLAQGVLENTTVSLTDVEQMNKLVKRMFISVKNATTRLSSGSHDPRNGQRMARGTGERAAAVSSNWTNQDNLLSYQRFRSVDGNGTVRNDNRQFTENKVDMTARIETIGGVKYAVYDIFFNNDGRAMANQSKYQTYRFLLQPKILDLASSGAYNPDTIRDLSFEIYRRNNPNEGGTLSQNPDKFHRERTMDYHFLNDNERNQYGFTYLNSVGVRAGRSHAQDMRDIFKKNGTDDYLEKAVKLEGNYSKYSYGLGLKTEDKTAAVHMRLKAKLRSGVTEEEVRQAFTIAVASTFGLTTNQSYVFGSGKEATEHVEPTVKQSTKYPISGKEVTKKVDESLGNLDRPVDAGFVTRNNNFPADIQWSWPSGRPSTTTAGVFRYQVKAQYSDNTSNTTYATLKVIPKKPTITASDVEHKKGLAGQSIRVNVGSGVKANSIVKLYDGNKVIGEGRTTGETATVTVSGALSGNPITAETIVDNGGTVISERSEPVTPTEVPDRVPPTVSINGNRLTTNADDNRFIIYRGANFNPTFRVQDDKNNVTLSITGLPNGVGDISKNGTKEFDYTIPDNYVADGASFGESTASVVATDGHNRVTYKFKYRIVDVQARNNATENRALGSELGDPHSHFKVAESNTVENDKYYPSNMQFVWKEFNSGTSLFTDRNNNTKLNELGNITKYYAVAMFPNRVNSKSIDGANYTIYSPINKVLPVAFNVTDNVKPVVKLVQNNQDTTLSESTPEANLPKVTVYRGEKAEITVKASDNTGKIKELRGSGMPNGIWFNKNPNANSEVWLSSDNATETNPLSHTITGVVEKGNRIEEKTVTINASDKTDPSNVTTVRFKVDVKEQKDKYTPTAGTTPVAVNNIGSISPSDLEKIKNSVTVPNLSAEANRDGGVRTSLKNNGAVTTTAGKKYVTVEVTYPDGSTDEVPVEVQQNTNVVKRPIINLKQGETLSEAEMKTIVELQDGSSKLPLPADAVVTATFDTNTVRDGNWTNITVRFNDGTSKTISANYNVKATFPVANTVYDFRGVTRTNDSESNYYINRNLPTGMSWFVKKGTENKPDARIQTYLATDGLGKTDYTFGAYYRAGRFNDNESNDNLKLKHEGTVSHHVYDVMAATNKITVNKGATLTEANAKAAVTKVAGSEDLPTGTTYEWVESTDTNIPGARPYKVRVTLPVSQPQTGNDTQPVATQARSSKTIDVIVNVKPEEPTYDTTINPKGSIGVPTVASTDRELTGTGRPGAKIKVTVPGVTINEVTVGDNGKWRVSLPKGLNSNQLNQNQLVPRDQVTVTQIVDGIESDATNVAVSLGETVIQPSEERGNSLFAGAKNIVVKAPHDAGMVYVSYTDKATGVAHEIGLKRENINSPWVSNKPTLGEVKNITKDAFTNTITIEMKESVAEGTAKAIANISEGKYSSAVDWKTIQVTNQAPTVTSAVTGNEKVVEFGENIDLKTLVTKADYEDDKDATRGTKVQTEIVSVNGQGNVKDINSRKPGTYTVKYKAIDSQGKESSELTITVKVREDKPTKPEAIAPSDGTVTVTPTGEADKVTVTYTDEKNAQKTVTVVKAKDGTWSSPEKPEGVTVNPTTGALLIPAEGVRDRSQVTATATKGDSRPSDPTIVTAQPKDFTPVKPDDKVPAKDKDHLTPDEQKQVEDKVKAKNPDKTVTVGEDGTATVTDPTTGISHKIP
ncbi:Rib/alpha-like domain-containing protein, partial [Streptococcus pneumoniae]